MMNNELTLVRPDSAEEALELAIDGEGTARFYAGGVEIVPQLLRREAEIRSLIDVKRIPGSKTVEVIDGQLRFRMGLTYREFGRSPVIRELLPVAARNVFNIGNPRVRSVGTIIGALSTRSTDIDMALLLGIHDAELVHLSVDGLATSPVLSWLESGEAVRLITEVRVPLRSDARVVYRRFPRIGQPAAAVAARLDPSGDVIRLIIGCTGMPPATIQVPIDMAADSGGRPAGPCAAIADLVASRAQAADALYTSGEYRLHLAGVLASRAVDALMAWSGDGGESCAV